ncbi:MAG: D-alanyl-D-alanine carboxypeptidase family protein [Candidatus Pacebacteria bacterium]|nr:D-alanyl-D-alanine carboxypeptidase family protein [Candidatus Paceibacterota bacterium]
MNKINFQSIRESFKKIPFSHWSYDTLFIVFSIVIVISGLYINNQFIKFSDNMESLSAKISFLENDFSSTTKRLEENIAKNNADLSFALNQEKQNLEDKIGDYRDEVNDITGTVSDLEKLSKIDPELLQKYSKVFFLNEHYSPARLTEIPSEYKYSDLKTLKIGTETWPYLKKMIDAAKDDNIEIYISSAFRSFNEQTALKTNYSVTYGVGTANQFSADQGYSEHQLGTTVDLTTTGLNGGLDGFDTTEAYKWLTSNAYKYGFVLSYPNNNAYYVYEPWHWRFVGIKLAKYLHGQNKNFYDLDQRKIDEYLINLF